MGTSDRIESFILELLKNDDGWLEIGRNELASVFNCVPSQINYVISTRFNPDRGYIVESRRGGGGCLRIKRIKHDGNELICKAIEKIGTSIDNTTANSIVVYLTSSGTIDEKTSNLILAAISDKSIPRNEKTSDNIRANVLKNMLLTLV